MNIEKLHKLTGELIAQGKGRCDVMIDIDSFMESENGSVLEVDSAQIKPVQPTDDSGPVGCKFDMLVLSGALPQEITHAGRNA